MYKLPKNENNKFISKTAKKIKKRDYDGEYIEKILYKDNNPRRTLPFSKKFKEVYDLFVNHRIINPEQWSYMQWALFCISYCYAKQPNPKYWDKLAENDIDDNEEINKQENDKKLNLNQKLGLDYNTNAHNYNLVVLFGKHSSFWITFISKTMFDYYNEEKEFEIEDLLKFIRLAAHKGACLLEDKYNGFQRAYKEEPYKAVSQFLVELSELAGKNFKEEPKTGGGEEETEEKPPIVNDEELKKLESILKECEIPVKKVSFSKKGVRYDIYEIECDKSIDLSKKTKNIADNLEGKTENDVISAGKVKDKSLTYYLKILRPENEWLNFGEEEFKNALRQYKENYELPICLGLDELGKPVFKDFFNAPHAIIGGTTGSGKSVAIKVIIKSLLNLTNTEQLEVIIIDPKQGVDYQELEKEYKNLSLITENGDIDYTIEQLVEEMNKRYSILRGFIGNKLTDVPKEKRPYPFKVVVIDELADLLKTNKDLAEPLTIIAQKARAVGIHLLLSTQRPDAKSLGKEGGTLASVLPTKIAFRVDKKINSNIILGENGAETLVGKGDHFVKWNGAEKMFLHGYNI